MVFFFFSLCLLFWFCPFLLLFLFLNVNKHHEKYSNEGSHGIAVAKGSISMANKT